MKIVSNSKNQVISELSNTAPIPTTKEIRLPNQPKHSRTVQTSSGTNIIFTSAHKFCKVWINHTFDGKDTEIRYEEPGLKVWPTPEMGSLSFRFPTNNGGTLTDHNTIAYLHTHAESGQILQVPVLHIELSAIPLHAPAIRFLLVLTETCKKYPHRIGLCADPTEELKLWLANLH
jgi:hypothetical protein